MHAHSDLIRTSHLSFSPLQVHPISGHPNSDCTTQGSLLVLSRCSLGVLRVKNHWASLRGALPSSEEKGSFVSSLCTEVPHEGSHEHRDEL